MNGGCLDSSRPSPLNASGFIIYISRLLNREFGRVKKGCVSLCVELLRFYSCPNLDLWRMLWPSA